MGKKKEIIEVFLINKKIKEKEKKEEKIMFEKVNPAHPDKIADRIAGALVDIAYKKEKESKNCC